MSEQTKPVPLWGKLLSVAAMLFLIVLIIGALSPPKTYRDIANEFAARCIRDKGDGAWRGSMGMTLEDFCKGAGALEAIKQKCADKPETC